jgi:hypothetical protein
VEAQSLLILDATPLTQEYVDEREARSAVAFWFARTNKAADVTARLTADPGMRLSVRQKALALVDAYEQARLDRQVEKLVRQRFQELLLRPAVLESLQCDPKLDEALRGRALALAKQWMESARLMAHDSRSKAQRSDNTAPEYVKALHLAERACELMDYEALCHGALGIACYRLQKYPEALRALTHADELYAKERLAVPPTELAFLAMTQVRLGQRKPAELTLARLHAAMQQPAWARDGQALAVTAEAQQLFADDMTAVRDGK